MMNTGGEAAEFVVRIAAAWGLVPREHRRVRKVWRLETARGTFCLKRSILRPEELLFVEGAISYLSNHGFSACLPSLTTLGGARHVRFEDADYLLYPWIESRESDFDDQDDLQLAVHTLSELHECSRGFIPYRSDAERVRWGLWPRILQARRHQLADFGQRACSLATTSSFCSLYGTSYPYFLAQASEALRILEILPYQRLCWEGVAARTICHHDFSARNLLIDAAGRATVVDFDYCLADLRLHDLANLLLRRLRHRHWQPAAAAAVLDLYDCRRHLDERELALLYPFLLWPQDFWQIGLQFFLEELPWPPGRFLRVLRHKIEERQEREEFLAWFRKEYYEPFHSRQ